MKKLIKISAIVAAMACSQAMAMPTGGTFTMGTGAITQNGKETVVTVDKVDGFAGTYHYAIDWSSLNLASDEKLTLNCPGWTEFNYFDYDNNVMGNKPTPPYVILQVLPGNASQIDGRIESTTCRVLLSNPDGMALSDTAVVDAPSFVGVAASSIEANKVSADSRYYTYNYMELTSAPVTATSKTSFKNFSLVKVDSYTLPSDAYINGVMRFNVPAGITAHTPILINADFRGIVFSGEGTMSGDTVLAGSTDNIIVQVPTVLSGRILNNEIKTPSFEVKPTSNDLLSIGMISIEGNINPHKNNKDRFSGYLNVYNAKSMKNISIINATQGNFNFNLNIFNPPADFAGTFDRINLSISNTPLISLSFTCMDFSVGDFYECYREINAPDWINGVSKAPLTKSINVTKGELNLSDMHVLPGVTVKTDKCARLNNVLNEGTLDFAASLDQCEEWSDSEQKYIGVPGTMLKGTLENKGVFNFGPMILQSVGSSGATIINSGTMTSKTDGSLAINSLINNGVIKAYGSVTTTSKSGSGTLTAYDKSAQDYIMKPFSNYVINIENKAGGLIDLLRTTVIDQPIDKPIIDQPIDKPIIDQPIDKPIIDQPIAKPIIAQPIAKPIIAKPIAKPISVAPVATVQKPAKAMMAR